MATDKFIYNAGYMPWAVLSAPPSSQPPRTTPQSLFTPQQQTTNANVSSVFSSTINRAAPSDVQERIRFYSLSAAENFQPRSEEMGRKLKLCNCSAKILKILISAVLSSFKNSKTASDRISTKSAKNFLKQ